ncbi:MAG TPA: ABC transporter substrate-binding protein [Burkholderiales bacterium]|nr:ABC transporter substrate-binding protein [Burkholderiales bacterium]
MKLSQGELALLSKWLDEALEIPEQAQIAWVGNLQTSERLKSLLSDLLAKRSDAESREIFNTLPKLTDSTETNAISAQPTGAIGPYRPLRELGRGGMGTVWLAERIDGLIKRPVALKLPHLGHRNAAFVERFHRERDILAALTHPYIARLYNAGFASNGQPFLALEYIENGVPITEYCDQQRLPIRARLKLFLQTLEAVQYAHLHQILHRDLKPSNMLVTTDGQVRLLDFGIAKLMSDGETSETELTQWGGRALTPTYASPEQIAGRPLSPSSDVYSLGMILYELLVGDRPYRLKQDSWAALEKAILSADPTPPSQRVENPRAAFVRSATIKEWARTLKGDLDIIALKALKKTPNERYTTVEAFAQDIERYLNNQPIRARADNWRYRAMKLIGRNKPVIGAAAAIVMSLGVGFGYAYWLYGSAPPESFVGFGYTYKLYGSAPVDTKTASIKSEQSIPAGSALESPARQAQPIGSTAPVSPVTPRTALNGNSPPTAGPIPSDVQSQPISEAPSNVLQSENVINTTPDRSAEPALSAPQSMATSDKILIGQSGEFSGEGIAKENTLGARMYFDYVNKHGGVHGKKIELLSLDDERNKEKTVTNTKKLITEDKVLALFGYRSTPTVEAVIPLTKEFQVPLIAPFTGAMSLREPVNPWMFHVRASYRREGAKIIETLTSIGLKKIAILHQTDSFGKDGLAGYQQALKEKNITPIVVASYDGKTLILDDAVKAVLTAQPQAVVMACTPSACAKFVQRIRAAGQFPQFMTLSNTNSDEFFKDLGKDCRGVGISQVMPYPWNTGSSVVKEFREVLKHAKETVPLSYATLEGFVAAKLLIEGLYRSGPNPTRFKLMKALEGLGNYDLGGLTVSYSPTDRTGTQFVELTVLNRECEIVR